MPAAAIRTFRHADFDAVSLLRAKGSTSVAVALPARDEGSTVGAIVGRIRQRLMDEVPLVDELVVIDDGSSDDTAEVAAAAGARVVAAGDVLEDRHPGPGKGQALWKSLYVTGADVVAWCDADVRNFGARFVVGLLGPLLTRPDIDFVKGCYERPGASGRLGDGGRVTELLARPLLAQLFPHLSSVIQPLAGEYAGRRAVLERVPFAEGYGVDIGLLIDVAERVGLSGLAQVDLGTRVHRNRPLTELSPQAVAVLHAVLRRAGVASDPLGEPVLARPGHDPVTVGVSELPALVDVPGYERRSA